MRIWETIRARLFLNILVLAMLMLLAYIYLFRQIVERDELIRNVTENYQPSLTNLNELQDKFNESRKLIQFWGLNINENADVFREEFNKLFTIDIPAIRDDLIGITSEWVEEDYELMLKTSVLINDSLYFSFLKLINSIKTTYTESSIDASEFEFMMQDAGIIFIISEIEQNLDFLIDKRTLEIKGIFNEISEKTHILKRNLIILSVISILLIAIFLLNLNQHLKKNIDLLSKNLSLLGKGSIPKPMEIKEKNEFEIVILKLNHLFGYMKNLAHVATRISKNDFSSEFSPLGKEDELGNAVINLQENLRKAHIEQLRYEEEEKQRSWISESIAKINDIIRISTDNIEELSYHLIKAIVEYTQSKLGGIFIINSDAKGDKSIDLIAAYAYDRKKNIQKKIKPGEGLIGRCVEEKESIYITDVPNGYLSIKSGLGENDPVSLLIVPLHLNDTIYGVIEIASFSEIEKFKIGFVETISENIATAISKLHTNLQTSILLDQTRQQAEELLSQEEEMRQNMEELTATQQKSAKKEEELLAEIKRLKDKIGEN